MLHLVACAESKLVWIDMCHAAMMVQTNNVSKFAYVLSIGDGHQMASFHSIGVDIYKM